MIGPSLLSLLLLACSVEPGSLTIGQTDDSMSGHTPRGFAGSSAGLFLGDDLSESFPEGDGTQLFLSFSLEEVPAKGAVTEATLSIDPSFVQLRGEPFADLGAVGLTEIRYDAFGSELWELEDLDGGMSCTLAESEAGPWSCEVADLVQRALDAGHGWAQVRLRADTVTDSDGEQDLFCFTQDDDINNNDPETFLLDVSWE